MLVSWCINQRSVSYSVHLRILAAMYLPPLLGAVVALCSSGKSSSSMVGGRSATYDVGSPAEKMVFPLGAMVSAACLSAGENDSCSCLAESWAMCTVSARWMVVFLATGLWSAAASSRFVLPPIAVSRCSSGHAILKKAPV